MRIFATVSCRDGRAVEQGWRLDEFQTGQRFKDPEGNDYLFTSYKVIVGVTGTAGLVVVNAQRKLDAGDIWPVDENGTALPKKSRIKPWHDYEEGTFFVMARETTDDLPIAAFVLVKGQDGKARNLLGNRTYTRTKLQLMLEDGTLQPINAQALIFLGADCIVKANETIMTDAQGRAITVSTIWGSQILEHITNDQ